MVLARGSQGAAQPRVVVRLFADAVGVPEAGFARLRLAINEVRIVVGVGEVANKVVVWKPAIARVRLHRGTGGLAALVAAGFTSPSQVIGVRQND